MHEKTWNYICSSGNSSMKVDLEIAMVTQQLFIIHWLLGTTLVL